MVCSSSKIQGSITSITLDNSSSSIILSAREVLVAPDLCTNRRKLHPSIARSLCSNRTPTHSEEPQPTQVSVAATSEEEAATPIALAASNLPLHKRIITSSRMAWSTSPILEAVTSLLNNKVTTHSVASNHPTVSAVSREAPTRARTATAAEARTHSLASSSSEY